MPRYNIRQVSPLLPSGPMVQNQHPRTPSPPPSGQQAAVPRPLPPTTPPPSPPLPTSQIEPPRTIRTLSASSSSSQTRLLATGRSSLLSRSSFPGDPSLPPTLTRSALAPRRKRKLHSTTFVIRDDELELENERLATLYAEKARCDYKSSEIWFLESRISRIKLGMMQLKLLAVSKRNIQWEANWPLREGNRVKPDAEVWKNGNPLEKASEDEVFELKEKTKREVWVLERDIRTMQRKIVESQRRGRVLEAQAKEERLRQYIERGLPYSVSTVEDSEETDDSDSDDGVEQDFLRNGWFESWNS